MFRIVYVLSFCVVLQGNLSGQIEICDNGIDDDNDSLIDINDSDCTCRIAADISLISNPSFEELDCCPSDKSQLFCASEWIQASAPTTDLIHLCGWSGVKEYLPPTPFPDGEGVLGFRDGRVSSSDSLDALWKEYAGACLISPMLADSFYRFQFHVGFVNPQISPPINISLFGTARCDHLPFGIGDVAFGCPSNSPDWMKIGEIFVDGGGGDKWVKAFIDINPRIDIAAIAIGPDCDPIPSSNVIYYYFDNLLLIDLASFDLQITEIEHPCSEDFRLAVAENSDLEYQWYFDGVAIEEENAFELKRNYGAGVYQVRILAGTSCRISAPYDYVIPEFKQSDTVSICQGDAYPFGNIELTTSGFYIETFKTQNFCDSVVALQMEVIGESIDSIERTIAPGETFELSSNSYKEEGEYLLSIPSELGCDSLIHLRLLHYKVFIPNVFSPNNDGVNDLFMPLYDTNDVSLHNMKIYDRWGALRYQGKAWDGSNLPSDLYIYIIDVVFANGQSNTFYGSLTLIR